MSKFASTSEAKQFLVERIAEEAQRECVSLSEVEKNMLYFSETAWTLPEIKEVNEEFDREYDQAEYEEKIANLIRGFRKYARRHSSPDLKSWDEAVCLLREEDHYLLVMVGLASSFSAMRRIDQEGSSDNRFAKLVLIGFAGFIVCATLLMVYMWLKN